MMCYPFIVKKVFCKDRLQNVHVINIFGIRVQLQLLDQ